MLAVRQVAYHRSIDGCQLWVGCANERPLSGNAAERLSMAGSRLVEAQAQARRYCVLPTFDLPSSAVHKGSNAGHQTLPARHRSTSEEFGLFFLARQTRAPELPQVEFDPHTVQAEPRAGLLEALQQQVGPDALSVHA